ncbi:MULTISPECIES: hypothetical protein [unclassified Azospirillum]|uniref:hypothetical protein n=1 Tax=unclassified Azospirillum TaxID=2630922 RepID=UPI000B724E53|nr:MULTISPECIES: hypothetical protein [unclassified Azospirillum]SNS76195.1 hypothetical protein SAMN05880556_11141 [Azospirillum sp. RU38E]SNS93363.1 hypothetical protein SAMN05880591_11141 [Azospirillum sp. RU37A]
MDNTKMMFLAEAMYQQSNTTGIPWSQRDRIVRKTWIDAARQQMEIDDATASQAATPPA